jgi:hypothetical protein
MKLAIAFLATIAVISAQPLPQLRIEPVDAGSVIYIRNVSAVPLTAFLLEMIDYPGSSFTFWRDEVSTGGIAPGVELQYRVTNMTIGASPDYIKVQAAVYLDGGSSGIPAKVALILARRATALVTTRELIRRMEKVGASKEVLSNDLKQWVDSLKPPRGASRNSPEAIRQDAAMDTVSSAIGALNEHSLEDTLRKLHETEKALAASRPPLTDK